jgi:tRNA(fMet)-specific endonuclease VapC
VTVTLYLLDTDTASVIIKGRSPEIEARLAEIPPDRVCVSAVTRAELMYGLKRISPSHRLQIGVRAFLRIVQVLAWDAAAADVYADIRHQLTSTGQPIGDMDLMIAAQAVAIGAVLVTNNTKHFGRISAPLVLVNWREGAM